MLKDSSDDGTIHLRLIESGEIGTSWDVRRLRDAMRAEGEPVRRGRAQGRPSCASSDHQIALRLMLAGATNEDVVARTTYSAATVSGTRSALRREGYPISTNHEAKERRSIAATEEGDPGQ
jgi:hypothetical protein